MTNNANKGAVWQKTAKSGTKYLSGNFDLNGKKYKITLFENQFKEKDTQPDYNIIVEDFVSENPAIKTFDVAKKPSIPNQEISLEDIPF